MLGGVTTGDVFLNGVEIGFYVMGHLFSRFPVSAKYDICFSVSKINY